MNNNNNNLAIGDEITVSIEKLIYGGEGLARYQGAVIFVPASAPGDQLQVRIISQERSLYRATLIKVLEAGAARRTPPCPYVGSCGGCQLQHLNYEAQLKAKAAFISEALRRVGRIDWPEPVEVQHAAEWAYRSRVQFKLDRSQQPLQIGFYKLGSHEVCDVENCQILLPSLNQALQQLRAAEPTLFDSKVPYSKLDIVAGDEGLAANQAVGLPQVGVQQKILGINYSFDPNCFFQVNRLMLQNLVETVITGHKGGIALDLYAGVGLFALQLARNYQHVIATEVNAQASYWARQNIKDSGLSNVEYYALSTERWLSQYARKTKGVELVVLDPPRVGITRKALTQIVSMNPREIVYVSCDPNTLARDLRILLDSGYKLVSVTGLDLFPQTYHIETVAKLQRA